MKKKKVSRKKFRLNKLTAVIVATLILALLAIVMSIYTFKIVLMQINENGAFQFGTLLSQSFSSTAGYEMPQNPVEEKQYLPEAKIQFDYFIPRDSLIYNAQDYEENVVFSVTSKDLVKKAELNTFHPTHDEIMRRLPHLQECTRPFFIKLGNHDVGPWGTVDSNYTIIDMKVLNDATTMSIWEYSGDYECPHIYDETRQSIIATLLSAEVYTTR